MTDSKDEKIQSRHDTASVDIKDEHALAPVDANTTTPANEIVALEEPKVTLRAQLLATAVSVGGFLFGYDIGVISGCLIMPDFVLRFGGSCPADGCALKTNDKSLITATLSIGTFFGSLLQAPVSDAFGRKPSMILWAVIYTIGAVIQTATFTSLDQMYVGRCIAGLGVGALSGLCPLYLGETAPKAVRGMMVSGYQLLIITGIALSYGIAWASQTLSNSGSWRIPVGLQMLWGILLVLVMGFLPESPRYRLMRGDSEGARLVMASMRGLSLHRSSDGNLVGHPAVEAELKEMRETIEAEQDAFRGRNYFTAYLLCFSPKQQMWMRTINGIMLQMMQQLNGQNFYYYYGPTFFQKANLPLDPFQIQFILGIVSLVCTVPALITIEKVGRRKGLMIGSIETAVCAYIVAFVGKYSLAPLGVTPNSAQKNAGNAFVAFAILHLAGYSTFWGPIPWVYLSESFPQHVRAKSISLGSSSNWLWNFLLSYFSPKVSDKYGTFIMLIFGSVMFFSFFYVFLLVPEVKGLSLEQVDEMYESHVPPWRSASWVPSHGNIDRGTLRRDAALT